MHGKVQPALVGLTPRECQIILSGLTASKPENLPTPPGAGGANRRDRQRLTGRTD